MVEPVQRSVLVRTFTPAGWLEGGLQVPERAALLDSLNRAGGLVRMVDVKLEGHEQVVPFLAVHRNAMQVVVPPLAETGRDDTPHGRGEAHDVAGVMPGLLFQGTVTLAPGMRMTDFFANAKGFVRISDCRVWKDAAGGFQQKSDEAEVLVFAPAIIALSDTLGT